MATEALEQRVARLEEQMRVLKERQTNGGSAPRRDWQSTVGMFRNDPIMKEIVEAGRQIREDDRLQAES